MSLLSITNREGEKLAGVLHESSSSKIIILCHGLFADKNYQFFPELAETLKAIAQVYRFDFSGNGESEGDHAMSGYDKQIQDLDDVVDYFASKKQEVVCIIGHSKAGGVVLQYGVDNPRVPLIVNICGRFDLTKSLFCSLNDEQKRSLARSGNFTMHGKNGKEYLVSQMMVDEMYAITMDRVMLLKQKVLSIYGTDDTSVPVEDAHSFDKLIPRHELKFIPHASHNFAGHFTELIDTIVTWVKLND